VRHSRKAGDRPSAASSHLMPTVLLVDDQAAIRELVERQLRAGGYRVIPAASGREALAILTHQAESIDLLLTDVMMPGMIGAQLVAIVQLRWPTVRAMYLTGGAEDWAGELMRETGAECLAKPFTADELRGALAAVLSNAALAED
jgi:two-component system cell cycle sensor histidine kinase/response regulator CckA